MLIYIGVWKLFSKKFGSAILFFVIGVVFLAGELGYIYWDEIRQFWPLVLIAIGIWFLIRHKVDPAMNIPISESDEVNLFAMFGGGMQTVISQNFRGGHAMAIFGGIDLNLKQVKLAPGKIPVWVFVIFGGIKVIVPEEWNVAVRGIPIFGGFEDARPNKTEQISDNESTLVVRGIVLFGGIEVKN